MKVNLLKVKAMKSIILAAALLLTVWPAHAAGVDVSFGIFYNSLGSQGEWLHVDGGVYAWRPHGIGAGWRPYYEGRWIWTDDGWYWASDEPWAWATYHYGRWYYDDYYGWVWTPGYDWAPAWVEWRYGGGCVGWAPLSPYAVFSMGWGIHYSRHWVTPMRYWTFLDSRHICDPGFHRYVYRDNDIPRVMGRTRGAGSVMVDGHRIVTRGPERSYIERTGHVAVTRGEMVNVADRERGRAVVENGGRTQVNVYRPALNAADRAPAARPEVVRQDGHRLDLDVRDTDVQRRVIAQQQGRDLNRAEQYRARNAVPPAERRVAGRERPAAIDRQEGAPPSRVAPDRAVINRRGPIDRPPRFDRAPGRVDNPERVVRRPVERPTVNRGGAPNRIDRGEPHGGNARAPQGADRGHSRR